MSECGKSLASDVIGSLKQKNSRLKAILFASLAVNVLLGIKSFM